EEDTARVDGHVDDCRALLSDPEGREHLRGGQRRELEESMDAVVAEIALAAAAPELHRRMRKDGHERHGRLDVVAHGADLGGEKAARRMLGIGRADRDAEIARIDRRIDLVAEEDEERSAASHVFADAREELLR